VAFAFACCCCIASISDGSEHDDVLYEEYGDAAPPRRAGASPQVRRRRKLAGCVCGAAGAVVLVTYLLAGRAIVLATESNAAVAAAILDADQFDDDGDDDDVVYDARQAGCTDPSFVADGQCDFTTNTRSCEWDGGDCCEDTCLGTGRFQCGNAGWQCRDPEARTHGEASILPRCDDAMAVGDGRCDSESNNPQCKF
jgi:hypothetical protein